MPGHPGSSLLVEQLQALADRLSGRSTADYHGFRRPPQPSLESEIMPLEVPRPRAVRKTLIYVASIGMMFIILFGIAIYLVFSAMSNLGPHYVVRDGKVYWTRFESHNMRRIETEVPEADAPTFRPYRFPRVHYGRDRDHVFFEGQLLRDASPETFEIVDHTLAISRDGDNQYERSRKVKNDAEQLVTMGSYSKDIRGVYWYDRLIPVADPASFEVIDTSFQTGKLGGSGRYARDAMHVYCNARVLEGANRDTFEVIGGDYGTDGSRVYHQFTLLENAHAAAFQVDYDEKHYIVGVDGKTMYVRGQPIDRRQPFPEDDAHGEEDTE